jgi:hypothetical protein
MLRHVTIIALHRLLIEREVSHSPESHDFGN